MWRKGKRKAPMAMVQRSDFGGKTWLIKLIQGFAPPSVPSICKTYMAHWCRKTWRVAGFSVTDTCIYTRRCASFLFNNLYKSGSPGWSHTILSPNCDLYQLFTEWRTPFNDTKSSSRPHHCWVLIIWACVPPQWCYRKQLHVPWHLLQYHFV